MYFWTTTLGSCQRTLMSQLLDRLFDKPLTLILAAQGEEFFAQRFHRLLYFHRGFLRHVGDVPFERIGRRHDRPPSGEGEMVRRIRHAEHELIFLVFLL